MQGMLLGHAGGVGLAPVARRGLQGLAGADRVLTWGRGSTRAHVGAYSVPALVLFPSPMVRKTSRNRTLWLEPKRLYVAGKYFGFAPAIGLHPNGMPIEVGGLSYARVTSRSL